MINRVTVTASIEGQKGKAIYHPFTESKLVIIQLPNQRKWLQVGTGTWDGDKIVGVQAELQAGLLDVLSSELKKKIG